MNLVTSIMMFRLPVQVRSSPISKVSQYQLCMIIAVKAQARQLQLHHIR